MVFGLAVIVGAAWLLLSASPAGAAPNDSRQECEASGGTWTDGQSIGGLDVPGICQAAAPDWTPSERALKYSLRTSLRECIRDGNRNYPNGVFNDRIETGNMDAGKWWKDSETGTVNNGYYGSPSFLADGVRTADESVSVSLGKTRHAGQLKCNNILQQAVAEFGFDSAQDLFCQIGGERENGSSCGESGSGKFKNLDENSAATEFDNILFREVWNRTPLQLGGASLYIIYQTAFDKACSPRENASAPADFRYAVTRVAADGATSEVTYEGKKRDTQTYVYTNNDDGQLRKDCAYIADKMNEYAGDYRGWIEENPDTPDEVLTDPDSSGTDNPPGEETNTCDVDGIGWIVCPVFQFLGDLNDIAYDVIKGFLLVRATTDDQGRVAMETAWSSFRDLANVAFVVLFLLVIYSQITGVGLNNYGIKKLLPKIVLTAVLVNTSYWICAIAIDLSNIVGSSITGFFDGIAADIMDANTSTATSPNGWDTAVAAILAAGVGIGLVILVILAPSVLLVLAVIWLILMARQAFIVLLVVIAPLAFVAYLLPNTAQWFQKWSKMFLALLMVFPIIGVVFGSAALASTIAFEVAGDDGQGMALIALGIQAIPLFAVPSLLKGSMAAAGTIGAKLSGFADARQKASVEKSRLGAYKKAWDRNREIKRAQVQGGVYRGRNPLARMNNAVSRRLNRSRLTGAAGTQVAQQGAALANKLEVENVQAATAQIQQANLSGAELAQLAAGATVRGVKGNDAATRAAAMDQMAVRGDFTRLEQAWDRVAASGNRDLMRVVGQSMARSGNKPAFVGAADLQAFTEGRTTNDAGESLNLGAMAARGGNRYSAKAIAEASNTELEFVEARGGVNEHMEQAAADALAHPDINKNIGNTRATIERIRHGRTATPIPTATPPATPPPVTPPPGGTP